VKAKHHSASTPPIQYSAPPESLSRSPLAWTASAARFREDANAEEELARGGYRDRIVVELAQNAADAAAQDHYRLAVHAESLFYPP
jgi:hypothetical protein